MSTAYAKYSGLGGTGGGSSGVSSVNTLTGDVTLAAGSNITITPSGNTLTFDATGGGYTPEFHISAVCNTLSTIISSTSFATFSNSPTLSFTATTSGTFRVYAAAPLLSVTAGNGIIGRIFQTAGAGPLLAESQAAVFGATNENTNIYMFSIYTLTAGQSYSFDIQGKVQSGNTGYLQAQNAQCYLVAEKIGN